MSSKIPYNKKLNSEKQWGSGGPRDVQRRQSAAYGSAVIQLPKMSVEELKQLLGSAASTDKNGNNQISFEEAKKKIDEAVQFTIKQQKERYESGLRNLNDQLNIMRRKAGSAEEQLVEKNAEIKRLKDQIINGPQDLNSKLEEKNNEISRLEVRIEEKDKVIEKLSDNYTKNINMLGDKIDEIDSKLSRGILSTGEYKGDSNRPKLEDDIFIDPIEDTGSDLDPHIEIKADDASTTSINRDIKEDLNKLKRLLNKSKDSLVEEVNTD